MTERRAGIAGAALLFLIINLVFAPFLWGDRTLEMAGAEAPSTYPSGATSAGLPDAISREVDPGAPAWQTEPEFHLEHEQLSVEHVLPLWNANSGLGEPLAADMQSQPYFPLTWLVELHPSPRVYNWYIALRFWIAALFTFLYLRLFVRTAPALGGAVAFAFTGYFVTYANMPENSVEILLPAVVWGVERLARRVTAQRIAALAIVVACLLFGGMPESAYLALLFAAIYGLARLSDPLLRGERLRFAGAALGGAVIGIASAAILILPFLEFAARSFNEHSDGAAALGAGADPWRRYEAGQYLMPLVGGPVWNSLFNGFVGFSELRGSWGVAPTLFALVALLARARDRFITRTALWSPELLFGAIAAILLFKRFGSLLGSWTALIPGFRQITYAKYDEAEIAFCVAALCGFGIAQLAQTGRAARVIRWAGTAVVLSVITATALIGAEPAAIPVHRDIFVYALLEGLAALAGGALLMLLAARRPRPVFAAAASALVLGDLLMCFFVPVWFVIDHPAPIAFDPALGAPFVTFMRERTRAAGERIFADDSLLYPEWSAAQGLLDVRDLNALYVADYLPFAASFVHGAGNANAATADRFTGDGVNDLRDPMVQRLFTLTSVRYVATQHPQPGELSLLQAAVRAQASESPTLRSGVFHAGGEAHFGVLMDAASPPLAVPVEIPRVRAALAYSYGEDVAALLGNNVGCGAPLRFHVAFSAASGARLTLLDAVIDPAHRSADRRWFSGSADLRAIGGQRGVLMFSVAGPANTPPCPILPVWGPVNLQPAPPRAADTQHLQPALIAPDVVVYRYDDALPRLAAYTHVLASAGDAEANSTVASADFDPHREAVVTVTDVSARAVAARFANGPRRAVVAGTIDRITSQSVEGTIRLATPSLVVLNDNDYPGWTATVDGAPTSIVRADALFRGVFVEAGLHHLAFRYQPRSFAIGAAVSALSVLAIAALFVVPPLTRRRKDR